MILSVNTKGMRIMFMLITISDCRQLQIQYWCIDGKISVLIEKEIGDCLKIREQATCGIDYNPGISFYSFFTKWSMILAAGSLHFWVTKFGCVAVYWRLRVCGLGCCCVCVKLDCGHCLLFPFPCS